MPLRSLPFPFPLTSRICGLRQFHARARLLDDSSQLDYYETLQIPVNASPAEVKKSFYSLSKTHHPDRNPEDPKASERFVRISDAYATLGDPAKRQKYDHEHFHNHHQSAHSHNHRSQGSYSSSGPAGGRPASGLSRRRTQFRGPPPSFYRSGGWGEHSAKRKAGQDSGAPGAEKPPDYYSNTSSETGGMGPGQTPFAEMNDVPHFDREAHFRTHENQQQRRARRRMMTDEDYVPAGTVPRGHIGNFIFVGTILAVGVFVPAWLVEKWRNRRKKEDN